ncbi:hypothetical protein EB796_008433 [Bugula neritina]|uniref:Reverse transcriptase domain-containing protein n=1 Tax=Bugula neritina TaxID=10212 RepID=A0A7J7K5M8_BUGNE|nr:hypothetical protein EB796_008433 [Bugula neritina]
MAFADDVVLLAENSRNLQRLLTVYTEHLSIVKDQAIPSLAAGETYKYLGIRVGTSRRDERRELYSACTESITKWLQNISSAPLKPQQRMKILRTHLLPRLTHSLVLGDPTKTLLRNQSSLTIRLFVNLILWLGGVTKQLCVMLPSREMDGDPDRAHQEKIRYYDCLEIRQWCRGLCEEATWQFGNATLN